MRSSGENRVILVDECAYFLVQKSKVLLRDFQTGFKLDFPVQNLALFCHSPLGGMPLGISQKTGFRGGWGGLDGSIVI